MASWTDVFLTLAGFVLLLPVLLLALEVCLAILCSRNEPPDRTESRIAPDTAVLVPAHNEEIGLGATLADIRAQLLDGERLIVVADNCTDRTAEVARSEGAEVVERNDPTRVGKGYALAHGIDHLASAPPRIIVIIDADCRLQAGMMDALVTLCNSTRRPVQAHYTMDNQGKDTKGGMLAFAWILKNYVRPLGLRAMGLPCQLMGTGMALPWDAVRSVDIDGGNLVEDVRLGLDLASCGYAPLFCPHSRIESRFAHTEEGKITQRQRWELGALRTLSNDGPRMLVQSLARRNLNLFALSADVMVPPIMILLIALGLGMLTASVTGALGLVRVAPFVFGSGIALLGGATLFAWYFFGRDVLTARDLVSLPAYLLLKIKVYWAILIRRKFGWIRTDRN